MFQRNKTSKSASSPLSSSKLLRTPYKPPLKGGRPKKSPSHKNPIMEIGNIGPPSQSNSIIIEEQWGNALLILGWQDFNHECVWAPETQCLWTPYPNRNVVKAVALMDVVPWWECDEGCDIEGCCCQGVLGPRSLHNSRQTWNVSNHPSRYKSLVKKALF